MPTEITSDTQHGNGTSLLSTWTQIFSYLGICFSSASANRHLFATINNPLHKTRICVCSESAYQYPLVQIYPHKLQDSSYKNSNGQACEVCPNERLLQTANTFSGHRWRCCYKCYYQVEFCLLPAGNEACSKRLQHYRMKYQRSNQQQKSSLQTLHSIK